MQNFLINNNLIEKTGNPIFNETNTISADSGYYFFQDVSDKNKFNVNGVIKGETQKYIYINRLDVDTPVLIDSAKISSKGAFPF